MIKKYNKKLNTFDKLIKENTKNLLLFVLDSQIFKLSEIDEFTNYIIKNFFTQFSDDFKFSLEIILKEAILNSFYHGIFNIDSKIKEKENGFEEFENLVKLRQKDKNYNTKKVYITIELKNNKTIIRVKDEGNGFSYNNLKIDNYKTYGRGIKLIKLHSDNLYWNKIGNEIIVEKNING